MSSTTAQDTWLPELQRVRRAIVVVDVVESVRLMQEDESGFIDRWRRFVNEVRTEVLPAHGGRMVKSLGDGMLLEFERVPQAVAAALDIQLRNRERGVDVSSAATICLRIGINIAEVVVDELDVYGSGVNLAARLAGLAAPGEIVGSVDVVALLVPGIDVEPDDLGLCYLKHIDEPVHAYRLHGAMGMASLLKHSRGFDELLPTLAVLPLQAIGSNGEAILLAHVWADNISARLCATSAVKVISRQSCSVAARRGLTTDEIGACVGATYIVSGELMLMGAQVRVVVELTDIRSNAVVWSYRARTAAQTALRPDDETSAVIAYEILQAVAMTELRRAKTAPLPTLEGFSLLVAAVALMHRSPLQEFSRAHDVLDQLIERHPRAPSPRAWSAMWYVLRVTRGLVKDLKKESSLALEQTRRALAEDEACSMALAMEAFVHCHMLRDLDGADKRLDHALAVNPNDQWAWLFRCVTHGFRGNGEQAWTAAQRALSLSPIDPLRHYFDALASSAALAVGKLTDAIELAERSLRMNRDHLPTLRALTIAYAEADSIDNARATAERVLAIQPNFTVASYLSSGPKGAEQTRERYAKALRDAGLPMH